MAQTVLNIDMLTNESLVKFKNRLKLGGVADRQYDDSFGKKGAKIGDTLRVREPVRMKAALGRALQVNTITEKQRPITVATQQQVSWPFNSSDMSLSLDEYSERYIEPAVIELASVVDIAGHNAALAGVYNLLNGGSVTNPNTAGAWLAAKAVLNSYSVPSETGLVGLINEPTEADLVDGLKGLFQSSSALAAQYTKGEMKTALGVDFMMTQNIPKFTTGTATSLGTINGTVISGNSVAVTGGTASGTVPAGTVFTVAGVFQYNLAARTTTSRLQQFVVTTAVTLNGSGAGTLAVQPEIVTSGNYQNMTTAGLVSTAATSLTGGGLGYAIAAGQGGSGNVASQVYGRNWLLNPKAIALVTADLPMVSAPEVSIKRGEGLSMRLLRMYDPASDQEIFRMDILFGWALMRPEWMIGLGGS